ncbi:MAG TPA: hypothetical protein VGN57_08145 [Pirellulaceae bacterium]|jgi:hypothetical protein|nr:hypothetical protein [Pirellulaceae bacterium]
MVRGRRLKTIGASLAIGAGMCALLCGIAGLFAAAASWRSATPAAAIERVLEADRSASAEADGPGETAANMRAIELEGTPADFQNAYRQHIAAWQRSSDVHDEAEDWVERFAPGEATPHDALYTTDLAVELSAEAQSRRRTLQLSRANAQDAIEATFHAVERVAEQHGARVSP